MNLDENIENENKKDEENDSPDKKSKSDEQEQRIKEKDKNLEEMSIESGIPDLENEAKQSDQDTESFETEDNTSPDLRKNNKLNFGDIKYRTYTEEFDEIIKAEDLENPDELSRLRKNLDQQLLQLKNFISKLANKLQRKL